MQIKLLQFFIDLSSNFITNSIFSYRVNKYWMQLAAVDMRSSLSSYVIPAC